MLFNVWFFFVINIKHKCSVYVWLFSHNRHSIDETFRCGLLSTSSTIGGQLRFVVNVVVVVCVVAARLPC